MTGRVCIATIRVMVEANSAVEACDGIGALLDVPDFVIDWAYLDAGEGSFYYPETYIIDAKKYEEGDFTEWDAPAPSSYAGEHEQYKQGGR